MPDSAPPQKPRRSVCVYCGSSESTRPQYHDLATRMGQALAARGLRLIYGGGSVGLMGRCARAAHAAGGEVLGVMPRFLERREIVLSEVPHRMVDTMHERKIVMFNEADAFVAAGLTGFPMSARLTFLVVGPMVDLKLIALQAGVFGRRFARAFAPLTLVTAVTVSAVVGAVLL